MTISNTTSITGDNIIALQNITAKDIYIGLKDGIIPEIKTAKEEIAGQIAELAQTVSLMANENDFLDAQDNDDDKQFEGINFTDLIEAIEEGNCVLFIGPEISIDENQNSLHELFNKRVSDEKRKYDENEGFFMPGSEITMINKAKKYYSGTECGCFPQENIIGTNLLKKIAQIPFKLIISLAPDDTLHRIFIKYNKKHSPLYYTGTKLEFDDDEKIDLPIIYNALGDAAKNGRYIYTHKQLNEFIKQSKDVKFPIEIEEIIEDTTHYLFIGFNFNKWHYRLLLFELNLLPDREGFAFKSNPINPGYQTFIHEQFKINFIDTNFQNFTNKLLQVSKEENLTKSLDRTFVENILSDIEEIRIKAVDSEKFEELTKLTEKLNSIEGKIYQYQQ
ncbi:MAG: SIR2 family protein [Bacteroidales bacterium]|nr:SIR2 family protein [Bacteroidales bacterium]